MYERLGSTSNSHRFNNEMNGLRRFALHAFRLTDRGNLKRLFFSNHTIQFIPQMEELFAERIVKVEKTDAPLQLFGKC